MPDAVPLFNAAIKGDHKELLVLLEKYKTDGTLYDRINKLSFDKEQFERDTKKHGGKLPRNNHDAYIATPLRISLEKGHIKCAYLFIEYGAKIYDLRLFQDNSRLPNQRSQEMYNLYYNTMVKDPDDPKRRVILLVHLIRQAPRSWRLRHADCDKRTPIYYAIHNNDADLAMELFLKTNYMSGAFKNILLNAVKSDEVNNVRFLMLVTDKLLNNTEFTNKLAVQFKRLKQSEVKSRLIHFTNLGCNIKIFFNDHEALKNALSEYSKFTNGHAPFVRMLKKYLRATLLKLAHSHKAKKVITAIKADNLWVKRSPLAKIREYRRYARDKDSVTSNVRTGAGVTSSSTATMKPLHRQWLELTSDNSDTPSESYKSNHYKP